MVSQSVVLAVLPSPHTLTSSLLPLSPLISISIFLLLTVTLLTVLILWLQRNNRVDIGSCLPSPSYGPLGSTFSLNLTPPSLDHKGQRHYTAQGGSGRVQGH